MQKLISIIIPAYNVQKYLANLLDILLKLDDKFFEVIVVNDASTDQTEAIARSYQDLHSNIKVITQENMFTGGARNTGIQHSNAKWLWFVDADDEIDLDETNKLVKVLKGTDVDVVIANGHRYGFSKIAKRNAIIRTLPITMKWNGIKYMTFRILRGNFNTGVWNRLYRKEYILEKKIQFTARKFHEDFPFNFWVHIENPRMIYVPFYIYKYIRRQDSYTQSPDPLKIKQRMEDRLFFTFEAYDRLKLASVKPVYKKIIKNYLDKRRLSIETNLKK